MFRALEHARQRLFPGAVAEDQNRHGAHSDDERLGEASLLTMLEFLWEAVTEVAAGR